MYARASVSAWKEGYSPEAVELPYVPLEKLEGDVAISAAELFPGLFVQDGIVVPDPVRARPVAEEEGMDGSNAAPTRKGKN